MVAIWKDQKKMRLIMLNQPNIKSHKFCLVETYLTYNFTVHEQHNQELVQLNCNKMLEQQKCRDAI